MARRDYPLSKVYGLLEPGPVVLVSVAGPERPNIMCMSWHTMMEFEPPLIGCVISNGNYSFDLLQQSGECVINIPTVEIADQAVGCGNTSGADIDKFSYFGLTPRKARCVSAPLIAECYANLECQVRDRTLVRDYCFFILEVVKAWKNSDISNPQTLHHMGWGKFMLAGEQVTLKSHMR